MRSSQLNGLGEVIGVRYNAYIKIRHESSEIGDFWRNIQVKGQLFMQVHKYLLAHVTAGICSSKLSDPE